MCQSATLNTDELLFFIIPRLEYLRNKEGKPPEPLQASLGSKACLVVDGVKYVMLEDALRDKFDPDPQVADTMSSYTDKRAVRLDNMIIEILRWLLYMTFDGNEEMEPSKERTQALTANPLFSPPDGLEDYASFNAAYERTQQAEAHTIAEFEKVAMRREKEAMEKNCQQLACGLENSLVFCRENYGEEALITKELMEASKELMQVSAKLDIKPQVDVDLEKDKGLGDLIDSLTDHIDLARHLMKIKEMKDVREHLSAAMKAALILAQTPASEEEEDLTGDEGAMATSEEATTDRSVSINPYSSRSTRLEEKSKVGSTTPHWQSQ